MKRLFSTIILTAACFLCGAQTRTYSDNASKTFIIGLESYFYGAGGSLDFQVGKTECRATVSDGSVSVNDVLLESGSGDTVIGIHDFTNSGSPELVVARRSGNTLSAGVYAWDGDSWKRIGRVGAEGEGVSDIRVFRQAVTIKNRTSGVLYTWTWHTDKFDFKASDGSAEPLLF